MDDSKRVVLVVAITLLILLLWRKQQLLLALRETIPKKSFHRKRKRQDGLDHLARFNDKEVKEQTSLSRTQFNYVLFLIEPELKLSPIQERMARCSSGEPMPVMLKLFMALRVLKGAQLNDLSQFTSAYKQVWGSTFLPVMEAIDKKLDNIHFKCNDPAWREETANQWAWQQQRKYNSCFWWGLLGCGDGLILKVKKWSVRYCTFLGIQVSKFWNRKGYYGVNVQAFCDAWCRFTAIEIHAPGATHDLKAYITGLLYKAFIDQVDGIPQAYYLGLDEAYKGIHDGIHMTPYAQGDIDKAVVDGLYEVAVAMRSFNKIFCSDRITIERTFGIFMRRYQLFWNAFPSENLDELRLVFRVACKLHNLCVDEWLLLKFGSKHIDYDACIHYPYPNLPVYVPNSEDATMHNMRADGTRDILEHIERSAVTNRGLGIYSMLTEVTDSTNTSSLLTEENLLDPSMRASLRCHADDVYNSQEVYADINDDLHSVLNQLDIVDQTTDAIAGIISSNGITPLDDMQLAVYLQNLYENNRSVTKRTNYASILQSFGICFETIDAMPI